MTITPYMATITEWLQDRRGEPDTHHTITAENGTLTVIPARLRSDTKGFICTISTSEANQGFTSTKWDAIEKRIRELQKLKLLD